MPQLLRMPEVAANATDAVLLSWPIAENVDFSLGDVIATVETDKAVVDVEAEFDGVILQTLVTEGTQVAIGEAIALIGQAADRGTDIAQAMAALGMPTPGTSAQLRPDLAIEVPEADRQATHVAPEIGQPAEAAPTGPGMPDTAARTFASPLARRLARDANLEINELVGSGPNNRIVRRDVETALAKQATAEAAPPPTTAPAPKPATASPPTAAAAEPAASAPRANSTFTDVPHTRQRQAIADRLTSSVQSAPHFYLRGSARVDRLLEMRTELNQGAVVSVTINDLVIKAMAIAHVRVPALNVNWTAEAIRQFSTVDIAVAVATESGLVTPVLRSVDAMSITTVAATVRDFVARAKAGRLQQAEIVGGSATVTNLGMLGVEDFSAIINPPQASILAVGAARKEPYVQNGTVVAATVMHVTLSVDHRPVDGATAARWMTEFLTLLENPVQILA